MVDPNLSLGASLSQNEILTPAKLHDLVDDSSLGAMSVSALYTGLDYVRTAAEGAPTTGDTYVDSAGALQVYDGSAYGPLGGMFPATVSFTHAGTVTLSKGMCAYLDGTASTPGLLHIEDMPDPETGDFSVIGMIFDDFINPGDAGRVAIKGLVHDVAVQRPGFFGSSSEAGSFMQASYGPGISGAGIYFSVEESGPGILDTRHVGCVIEDVPKKEVNDSNTELYTCSVYIWR